MLGGWLFAGPQAFKPALLLLSVFIPLTPGRGGWLQYTEKMSAAKSLKEPGRIRFIATVVCLLCLVVGPASPAAAFEGGILAADSTSEPPPAPGGIGVRLMDIPVDAVDDPRARSYIVDRVPPGTTLERRIEVQNNSDEPQSIRIYPGAARIEDGTFTGEEDPSENELTTWISVEHEQLELAAGESAEVPITIDVPEDAPEAEQYAAVWAEVRGEAAEGSNVIQASRVGIRIYLSVGPGNGKPADFEIGALTAGRDAAGRPQIIAEVTNTGGRAVDVTGELDLREGPGGLSAGPFALERATTIAPEGTGNVTFTMDPELPDGPWNTQLRLESGTVEHEAAAELTFPDAGEEPAVVPADESGTPWVLIAAAIVVFLILAAILSWRLRKQKTTA